MRDQLLEACRGVLVVALLVAAPAGAQELPSASLINWATAPEALKQAVVPHGTREDREEGPAQLPGAVYLGLADLDPAGSERGQVGAGLHLQGMVSDRTRLTLAMARGPTDMVSLLALGVGQGTTVQLELLHPRWRVVAGDFIAPTHALSAVAVRADGFSLEYDGRLVADVFAGRPKYLDGGGGHFIHASVGLALAPWTLRLVATDLVRPPPTSARVKVVTAPTVESERDIDDLARVVQLLPGAATLRVAGVELAAEGARHDWLLRSGVLDARGTLGDNARGVVTETRYSFTAPSATLSAYARHAPGATPETHLGGDAGSLVGTATFTPRWKLVGRALWSSTPVPRLWRHATASSASTGMQYMRARTRLTVQGKYDRLGAPGLDRETLSLNLHVDMPWRWFTIQAQVDGGRALQNGRRRPYRSLRARLGVFDDAPVTLGLSATYDELGAGAIRRRLDADFSASWGNWVVDAGAGVASGQLLGKMQHLWASMEVPWRGQITWLVSAEHVRWHYAAAPYLLFSDSVDLGSPWRVTVGVRRPIAVALPFLRATRESRGRTP